MNLGTENRTKLIVAIALGAFAVLLLAYEASGWFGASSSAAAPVASETRPVSDSIPAPRKTGKTHNLGSKTAKKDAALALDPSLHLGLLKESEDVKYEGTGRNIFRVFVEPPPKPIVSPAVDHQQQQQQASAPPPPPPPPPINLVFYGFATPAGGSKRIFLAQGEDVFIAREGDIVDRRYKVVRISPTSVEILDVLSNNRQSIPLTQG